MRPIKKSFLLVFVLLPFLPILSSCGGAVDTKGVSSSSGNGSVTLSWDAPATRTDGSSINPATDILSYKVYYGAASGKYTQSNYVPNPGAATITYTFNISPGTYYFVVTAIDQYGQESSYSSPPALKTI